MIGPGDVYAKLPAGLCRARKRFRFDSLVCVHYAGHRGHHAFVDPWTVVRGQAEKPCYYPLKGSHPCARWQRAVVDLALWAERSVPFVFWGGRLMAAIGFFFCVLVKQAEGDLNHPAWRAWQGCPGSRWGPLCPWVCRLTDFLTGGRCHD